MFRVVFGSSLPTAEFPQIDSPTSSIRGIPCRLLIHIMRLYLLLFPVDTSLLDIPLLLVALGASWNSNLRS